MNTARVEADYTVGEFSSFGLPIAIHEADVILLFWGVEGDFGSDRAAVK